MRYWFEDGADVDKIVDALDAGRFEAEEDASEGGDDGVASSGGNDALPERAVEAGAVDSVDAYYDRLHAVTLAWAEHRIAAEEGTPERDLVHGVRALDALDEASGTLAETADGWRPDAGDRGADVVAALDGERDRLEERRDEVEAMVRTTAEEIAPTLSAIAGPILAARLVELAGGLEDLATMPSGTVQVLGAEDALFRHLTDGTPPPKHGAIYLHPAVRGAPPDERGRVARTLAGKLAIAARIDHFRGERDDALVAEWEETRAAMEAERDGE